MGQPAFRPRSFSLRVDHPQTSKIDHPSFVYEAEIAALNCSNPALLTSEKPPALLSLSLSLSLREFNHLQGLFTPG